MSDSDSFSAFQSAAPGVGIEGMERRVDMDSWSDLSIIANFDEIAVQEHAPVVDEPIAADADVLTVVTAEGRLELSAVTDTTQQQFQLRSPKVRIFIPDCIQPA